MSNLMHADGTQSENMYAFMQYAENCLAHIFLLEFFISNAAL